MKYLLIFLLISIPLSAQAEWSFLNHSTLFNNPLAYPRSPSLGLSINTSIYQNKRLFYFDAVIGKSLSLICYDYQQTLGIELGLEGGAWLTLIQKDSTSFLLLTEDYLIAIPLSFRLNNFIFTIKWNHISAHMGDGMGELMEKKTSKKEKETLEFYRNFAKSYDINLSLAQPILYSRDFVSSLFSYQYAIKSIQCRSYLHLGYIYKLVPEEVWNKNHYIGVGTEFKIWNDQISPYGAIDITWNQDTESTDISTQLGFLFKPTWNTHSLFINLNTFNGKERKGQLLGSNLNRVGIGLMIR